jgi:hypothetical protein
MTICAKFAGREISTCTRGEACICAQEAKKVMHRFPYDQDVITQVDFDYMKEEFPGKVDVKVNVNVELDKATHIIKAAISMKPGVCTLWYWLPMYDGKGQMVSTWSDECRGPLGECLSQIALDREDGSLVKWQITAVGVDGPHTIVMSGDID